MATMPSNSFPDYFDITCQLVDNGLSVIPIKLDGSKRPDVDELEPYFERKPFCRELHQWFFQRQVAAYGIIGGIVSNGLEIVDFDDGSLFEPWRGMVADIVSRCPVVATPSGGFHVYFRCCEVGHAKKIARAKNLETLIETRGERSLVVGPASSPLAHPTRNLYRRVSKVGLLNIPVITPSERKQLWAAARTFDRAPKPNLSRFKVRCDDNRPLATRKESARRYVAKMEASVSGCSGHNKAFAVAKVLIHKFGLPSDDALELFKEFNERCQPPWNEKEIIHKLESAAGAKS